MKRIMMLGGSYFQVTATKAAREAGYHVISVDYLPENPGHRYAHEYYNVSTTDREAVLDLARNLDIDGIVSYASDVSAPTAAYVAQQLGLPTNPLSSVEIMTHKDSMRAFMLQHGFSVPKGAGFRAEEYEEARSYFASLKKPAMIKPVDACGSKGVSRLSREEEFAAAWQEATQYSRNGRIILEEFIQRTGYQIDGDIFMLDGQIVFDGLMNQHHDSSNSDYVSTGSSYPCVLPPEVHRKALHEVQRLLGCLGMKQGGFNVEFVIDREGTVYILEIGPRSGGNLITDAIRCATGVDLARATVQTAVGDPCDLRDFVPQKSGYVSSFMIHSNREGILKELVIADELKADILRLDLWSKPGDRVYPFHNASFGIGAALIQFPSAKEMCSRMDHMEELIRAELYS